MCFRLPQPSDRDFQEAFLSIIATVRSAYSRPSLPFFLQCGPAADARLCANLQSIATQTNSTYIDMQWLDSATDYGCDNHPNTRGDEKMAERVVQAIKERLGWTEVQVRGGVCGLPALSRSL